MVHFFVLNQDGLEGGDSAKGMWYEDHLSPDTLEARADETIRSILFAIFSAGHGAVTRTVQGNPVPARVCS